jgi:hypothetical protein
LDFIRRAIFKWPNGTVEEVVMAQGDSDYLDTMLKIAGYSDESESTESLVFSPEMVRHTKQAISSDTTTQLLNIKPLQSMVQQLKSRVDDSLSLSTIAILGITYPIFFDITHQNVLRKIVREAGLIPSLSYFQTNSAIASAAANGVRLCQCPVSAQGCAEETFPDKEMILYIDYSDILLTILLYEGHNPEGWNNGGITYLKRAPTRENSNEELHKTYWNTIVAALREIISDYALNKKIDHLVLTGIRADDHDLHNAIQSAVGGFDRYPRFNLSSLSDKRTTAARFPTELVIDPTSAAARGVADLSWRQNMRTCIDPCSGWRKLPPCYEIRRLVEDGSELPFFILGPLHEKGI